jgi:NADPH:quinone reductase
VIPLPAELEFIAGASIPEAFLTAFLNLVVSGGIEAGQSVLVHAAASGVGLAAIGVAKYYGARVAATTRTRTKLEALHAAGADLAVQSQGADFATAIEARWGRDAVHVVLDPIGQATLPGDLRVLAPRGRIVLLAAMSGGTATLDLGLLLRKRAEVRGSTLRSRPRAEKAALVGRFRQELLPAFGTGQLRPTVDAVVPAARATEAFECMRANANTGKLVLDWTAR